VKFREFILLFVSVFEFILFFEVKNGGFGSGVFCSFKIKTEEFSSKLVY